jgi:hypothetical protein
MSPLLAQSGHGLVHCTRLLLTQSGHAYSLRTGIKQQKFVELGLRPILDSSLRRSENLIQHNDAPAELNSLGVQGVVLVVYGDAARASDNDRSHPEISNRLSFLWVV